MSDSPSDTPAVPAFAVTLSAQDMAYVGLFCTIWGQIDFLMGASIAGLIGIDPGGAALLMETMTSGPRLNLFYRVLREIVEDKHILAVAKSFNADMSPLIEKRNHLMHGLWGNYIDAGSKRPASFYIKTRNKPLFPEELLPLIERAKVQSQRINEIAHHVLNLAPHNPLVPEEFSFGEGQPEEPLWRRV